MKYIFMSYPCTLLHFNYLCILCIYTRNAAIIKQFKLCNKSILGFCCAERLARAQCFFSEEVRGMKENFKCVL